MFRKKIFSIVLCVALVMQLVCIPQAAVYAESGKWDGTVDVSWYEEQGGNDASDYYISTPAELAGLAAMVNGKVSQDCKKIIGNKKLIKCTKVDNFQLTGVQGGSQSDTVYVGSSEYDFMGKTIHITADLDMGGVYKNGKWSGPNWTPIGGKFPMDTRSYQKGETKDVQTIESIFNGVLDGGGHKIENLYCNRYTDKDFGNSMAIGLVGYIADDYDTNPSEKPEGFQPGVKNLTLNGYVYGRRMVGGIVGNVGDLEGGAIIENCGNHADVRSTDSRGRAGIVGRGYAGKIVNCYNTGDISGSYPTSSGGIVGENAGLSIYNCYNTGTITVDEARYARGIGGHDDGSYTVANCYYLEGCDSDPDSDGYYKGVSTSIKVDVQKMTSAQMKGTDLYNALNKCGNAFAADTKGINGGYPVLFFETDSYDTSKTCKVTINQAEGGTVTGSIEGEVPYGSVVHLSYSANGGYTLDTYTANGNEIYADYYTVTSDVTLSAKFIRLEKGSITFEAKDSYQISGKKSGTILENGETVKVSDRQILKDGGVYQLDELTVRAVLKDGATPENENLEYTGGFVYTYAYGDGSTTSNESGKHKVTTSVTKGLTVTAEPKTQGKRWMSVADTSWYDSSKSSFTIKNANQLAGLAYLVNTKGYSFKGKTIKLANDISLANNDGTEGVRYWNRIGSSSSAAFKGIFDGQCHTIKNMTAKTDGSYSGLFGYVSGGTVKNLTVRGTSEASDSAAGIASYCDGATILNCNSYVEVIAKGNNAGGVAAKTKGGTSITNCINKGSVTAGSGNAGGITGESTVKKDKIKTCVNYGSVAAAASNAGGIVGKVTGCIRNCANYGQVKAANYAGGLAGHTTGWEIPEMKNSYNQGIVSSEGTAGGLAGYAQNIEMYNCYNAGEVSGSQKGALAGNFNKSIQSSAEKTYYINDIDAFGNQSEVKGHEYVSVTGKTADAMKTSAFAATLNKAAKGVFTGKNGSLPVLSSIAKSKEYTVTYTGDYTGTDTVYYGGSVNLPEAAQGRAYVFKCNGKEWDGRNIKSSVTVTVSEKDATYAALLRASGKTVNEVPFTKDTKSITLPSVPVKNGNDGVWSKYVLDGKNIAINAVYTKQYTDGDVTLDSGYYYINPSATGTITVTGNVTLDGDDQNLTGLAIYAAKGSVVTIKNVNINNPATVMTLDNATVKIEGENSLIDSCTESGNENPCIRVKGTSYITGSGSLYGKSGLGNYAVQLEKGSTLVQKSGTVKLYDDERTGGPGGIVNGLEGSVKVQGGTFAAVSDTNKIYALYVKNLTVTGGNVLICANDADERKSKSTYGSALYCKSMKITGGSLKVYSKIHETDNTFVRDSKAIVCKSFTKNYYRVKVKLPKSSNTVKVDGKTVYKGAGYAISFSSASHVYTDTKDEYAYIWVKKGTHKISVNGKTKKVTKAAVI